MSLLPINSQPINFENKANHYLIDWLQFLTQFYGANLTLFLFVDIKSAHFVSDHRQIALNNLAILHFYVDVLV